MERRQTPPRPGNRFIPVASDLAQHLKPYKRYIAGACGVAVVTGAMMTVNISTDIVHPLKYGDLPPLDPVIYGETLPRISAPKLVDRWEEEGYTPLQNSSSAAVLTVPRRYMVRLPADLSEITDIDQRKRLFLRIILPMVLRTNDIIREHRKTIEKLAAKRARGHLTNKEARWLRDIADFYEVNADSIPALKARANPIPVSLTLAQAAIESGWGTSRFALRGNALFGQWIWGGSGGLTPKERAADKTHRIKAFPSLLQSVWDYMHNLNTHPAYQGLRQARHQSALAGEVASGSSLASHLEAYSEKGSAYVDLLREIIEQNGLSQLDQKARLNPLPQS